MQKQGFFFSAILIMVFAVSPIRAALVAITSTSAIYKDTYDSDNDTSYTEAVPAEAHAYSAQDSSDFSKADAYASIGGVITAYCESVGAYGGPIEATANASHTTEWLINSTSLPLGTEISVLIDVDFHGSLISSYSGQLASAGALLTLGTSTIYEASGTREHHTVTASGMWIGDFTNGVLDTIDTLTFDTVVGDTIELTLSLLTEASSTGNESWAVSDFSNSGSYTFVGAEDPGTGVPLDVTFEIVPEPGTILLLGLGSFGLIRKR